MSGKIAVYGLMLKRPEEEEVPLTGLTLGVGRYYPSNVVDSYIQEFDFILATSTIEWGDGSGTTTFTSPIVYPEWAHEYPTDGTYTIRVVERSAGVPTGRGAQLTINLTELDDWGQNPYGPYGEPASRFTIKDEALPFYDFSATLTPPITSWLWDFGDGQTSTLQNPTHTYTTLGVFTPTLAINGGTPATISTVESINLPAVGTTAAFADNFTGNGVMNSRVPTTPLPDVFANWVAADPDMVTSGGVLIHDNTDSYVNAYSAQLNPDNFSTTIVPPADLKSYAVEFDWTTNAVPTGGVSYAISVDLDSVTHNLTGRRTRGQIRLTPWEDGRVQIFLDVNKNVPGGGSGGTAINLRFMTVGTSFHIKALDLGTYQYIFANNLVTRMSRVETVETAGINFTRLTLPPKRGAADTIDNFALSKVTPLSHWDEALVVPGVAIGGDTQTVSLVYTDFVRPGARANSFRSSGKVYFELVDLGATPMWAGIRTFTPFNPLDPYGDEAYPDTGVIAVFWPPLNQMYVVENGDYPSHNPGITWSGNTLQVAVDIDAGTLRLGVNNVWGNIMSIPGIIGQPIAPTAICANSGAVPQQVRMRTFASQFTGTIPSGYTAFDPGSSYLIYDTFTGSDGTFVFNHTGNSGVQWLMDDTAISSATLDNEGLVLSGNRLLTQGNYGGSNLIPTVAVDADSPYFVQFDMYFIDGTWNGPGVRVLRAADTTPSGRASAEWLAEVGHEPADQQIFAWGNVASASGIAASTNAKVTARFEFDGASLVIKINGVVVVTDTHALYQTLPGGYIGMQITDGVIPPQMTIDNYIVDYLPVPAFTRLIRDDFTGSGTLSGRVPDTQSTGAWTEDVWWLGDAGAIGTIANVQGGQLVTGSDGGTHWAFGAGLPLPGNPLDGYVEARLRANTQVGNTGFNAQMGLRRVSGSGAGVFCDFYALDATTVTATIATNGTPPRSIPDSGDFGVVDSSNFVARMEVVGSNIKLFLDGVLVIESTLNTPMVTGGGVWFAGNPATFDYVEAGTIP